MSAPIFIFGGTFDPIHNGHLQVAKALLQKFPESAIRFIPCQVPLLKTAAQASPADRLAMLKLAITDLPNCSVDTRELDRNTPSYMIDTLISLRKELGTEASLVLIVGADAFAQLPQWHRAAELANYAEILVIDRPGHHPPKVEHLNVAALAISSTTVRTMLAQGEDVSALIPATVYDYIQAHTLYS